MDFHGKYSFTPNGKIIASNTGPKNSVTIWEPVPGKEPKILATLQHKAIVCRLAFTSDGNTLVAGADDGTLTLWDTNTWKERLVISAHKGALTALAVSPDGKVIATGGEDRRLKFWDTATGKERAESQPCKGQVWCVAFSPDCNKIAWSAGEPLEQGEVKLASVATILEQKPAP